MRTHLSHRHKSLNLDPGVKQLSLAPTINAQTTLRQSWGPLQKNDLPKAKSYEITRNMALMCALDQRLMSMVEGLGLKNFVYSLNPEYVVPSRNTVTKVLHKIYDDARETVIAEMKGHPVSLTSDMWRSVANQIYISLTGHYIKRWNLYSKTLATRLIDERHYIILYTLYWL